MSITHTIDNLYLGLGLTSACGDEAVVVAPDDGDGQTLKEPYGFANVTRPPRHASAQVLEKLEGNWAEDPGCLDGDRREEVSGLKVGVFRDLPLFSPPSRVTRVNR